MVQALKPAEAVLLDEDRVEEIIARLGARGAEDVIATTMEELAVQLAKVHTGLARGLIRDLAVAAVKIADISAHVGLLTLRGAAKNVADAAGSNCSVSLAATAARLDRVGEASLMQVWDSKDQSM